MNQKVKLMRFRGMRFKSKLIFFYNCPQQFDKVGTAIIDKD
jgi:hypothetical protein